MGKIICDVCGTSFADSANQCPICGCASSAESNFVIPTVENKEVPQNGSYTYVKGGRFSKANVKKRNNGKQPARLEREEKPEKQQNKKKSNRGLVITALALLLAIIAVAAYIAFKYFIPTGSDKQKTYPTAPSVSENVDDEPVVEDVPCEDLTAPISLELTDENKTAKLDVTVLPENTTDTVQFSSNNEAVVTVDAEGNVTALSTGSAVIEIVCGDKKVLCQVKCTIEEESEDETESNEEEATPQEQDKPVTGEGSNALLKDGTYKFNTFNHDLDFSLYVGNSHELVLRDANNNRVDITVTSKTPGVCVVEGNVVKGVASGNAKIVVTFGDGANDYFVGEVIVW